MYRWMLLPRKEAKQYSPPINGNLGKMARLRIMDSHMSTGK
jgi:hypothetical protein